MLQARGLRECYKVRGGRRRSSARASVFEQGRNSLVSDTQEFLEKLLGAEDLNKSFRIQFEESEQQEEMMCSSYFLTHYGINNPLCIFFCWKVLP